ncbi:MAG: Crp/Fnr family transcriptional regulator [Pseudomonadota bacterium]
MNVFEDRGPAVGNAGQTLAAAHAAHVAAEIPDGILNEVRRVSMVIENTQRHAFSPIIDGVETVYIPVRGLLVVDGGTFAQRPRILGLLYPGDFLNSLSVPPFEAPRFIGSAASMVLRLPAAKFKQLELEHPAVADWVSRAAIVLQARLRLHLASLSALTSEMRVASFLAELGYRLGPSKGGVQSSGGRVSFQMPLSRMEMASYLALNADTLSRIMSKFRADGLISTSGRNGMTLRDFPKLLAETPFASTITSLHLRA